jgi:N-acetylmuramoyl-L-alanine amidase
MHRVRIQIIATLMLLSVILSMATVSVSAATVAYNALAPMNSEFDVDGREYKYLKGITNTNVWSYVRPNVIVGNSTTTVKGLVINGVSYIPFRQAASLIHGSSYSYDSKTKTSVMRAPGLEIVAGNGCYVTYANGRALFNTTPNVIMSDGRMYIPASIFAKAVGMRVDTNDSRISLSGSYSPLIPADKFYREDEVFWLARIIHAESRGEALLGQIAVGNVVLNRVRSAYYPNTIYGVIFDRKYGVQFSPVLDGTIYNTPGYNATLAAKICLEGYDVSEGAFFFLAPELATSSWIPRTREYAFTIGNHDFYK